VHGPGFVVVILVVANTKVFRCNQTNFTITAENNETVKKSM